MTPILPPDDLEKWYHKYTYQELIKYEIDILNYQIDITKCENDLGFYTLADYPDMNVVNLLNSDLKYWLIFYGAPFTRTLDWWRVVVHHRDRSCKDILNSLSDRYEALYSEQYPEEAML